MVGIKKNYNVNRNIVISEKINNVRKKYSYVIMYVILMYLPK